MTDGPQRDPDPDYKAMSPGKMLDALGDNAYNWATAYCQFFPHADHGLMLGWFANAIEQSWEDRMRRFAERFPETKNHQPVLRDQKQQ